MSCKTYGYVNEVNRKWLGLLGLNLIENQDEFIVLGREEDIKEYQEREGTDQWTECI